MNSNWTLMSSHGTVLFYIALNQNATIRDIASATELTERRVSQIVRDLAGTDILGVQRRGRQNAYWINMDATFETPANEVRMGAVVDLLHEASREKAAATA